MCGNVVVFCFFFFFFQAEDGIRDLVRSRGLGDVYKRQSLPCSLASRAVMSEPDLSAASTTSVPKLSPEMMLSLIHI